MSELDDLAERLQRAITHRPPDGTQWREPTAMPAALARVRDAFSDRLQERSGARTNRSLLAFRLAPQTIGDVDLKLVCRALTRPADWEQRRLIDDDGLFAQLLAKVDGLRQRPRHHQACLRALAAACAELSENNKTLHGNELRLQSWLNSAFPP